MIISDFYKKIQTIKLVPVMFLVMLISPTTGLNAQSKHLATPILIQFYHYMFASDMKKFESDYNQYKLQQASGFDCPGNTTDLPCNAYWFIFDNRTIDADSIEEIFLNDERIWRVILDTRIVIFNSVDPDFSNLPNDRYWVPRYARITLKQGVELDDILNDYSEYNLGYDFGSLYTSGGYFSFNDSLIYTGDFFNILREDKRITEVWHHEGWVFGEIFLTFEDWVSEEGIKHFIDDYSDLIIKYPIKLESIYMNWWIFKFDFNLNNEFYLKELLNKDERVVYAGLHHHILLLGCGHSLPQVTANSDTITRLSQTSVYPNPSQKSDINFKISNPQYRNQRNGEIEISIYNVKGQLVKSSKNFLSTNTDRVFVWDRKDNNNKYVASGVYTYKIKLIDNEYTGKLLIVK